MLTLNELRAAKEDLEAALSHLNSAIAAALEGDQGECQDRAEEAGDFAAMGLDLLRGGHGPL